MKEKINFTLNDLLICYAWNRGLKPDYFARYLRDVCRVIRDNTHSPATSSLCRRFIKLVKMGKSEAAINCLRRGYVEEYIRS
jgi:hypothetical protein